MGYECCLCSTDISHKSAKTFWCSRCYSDFKEDILAKKPWCVWLQNEEAKRRYRQKDIAKLGITYIYIGNEYDLSEDGKLLKIHDEVR